VWLVEIFAASVWRSAQHASKFLPAAHIYLLSTYRFYLVLIITNQPVFQPVLLCLAWFTRVWLPALSLSYCLAIDLLMAAFVRQQ